MGSCLFLLKRDSTWSQHTCILILRKALTFFRTVSPFEIKRVSLWSLKLSEAVFQALHTFNQDLFCKVFHSENMGHFPSVLHGLLGFWVALPGFCRWFIKLSPWKKCALRSFWCTRKKCAVSCVNAHCSMLSLPWGTYADRWLLLCV